MAKPANENQKLPNDLDPNRRAINWLENADQAVARANERLAGRRAQHVAERLSALLLARIPQDIGRAMLSLLPHGVAYDLAVLSRHAESDPDRSIGFIQFAEAARAALGNELGDVTEPLDIDRKVAEAFLWAIGGDLPAELKSDLLRELPGELRSRMNLYSAHSGDEKVA